MSCLGNLLWLIFGGFIGAIEWLIAGLMCCITVVGIPFGLQCFKMAQLQLAPFGKTVRDGKMGVGGTLGNVLWIVFFGLGLCVSNLVSALLFAITIVGIPFAVQSLKLAKLSLMPFGKYIE